jgi:hypothetical protein
MTLPRRHITYAQAEAIRADPRPARIVAPEYSIRADHVWRIRARLVHASPPPKVAEDIADVLDTLARGATTRADIVTDTGRTGPAVHHILARAIRAGLVEVVNPDAGRAVVLEYRLTRAGRRVLR